MLLVKRFINTVRKCRPPGKRLASRTWKRADSPSASEREIHKPQRPHSRASSPTRSLSVAAIYTPPWRVLWPS